MSIDNNFNETTRRAFLKRVVKFLFSFSSIFLVILGLIIFKPSNPRRKEYKFYYVSEDKIPREGVKKIEIETENFHKPLKVFLVRTEGSIIALSPVCTHLGCFVNYDRNSTEFICPCHGGKYDINGNVIAGPPKEPLLRLPVKIENEKVYLGIKI
ncbi:MAG: Rieske (2Fe-2S) protein [Thermodesulfovibrio sp.]|nr:Rieske (2Fe-2S) protein [Thermodesulfovibrio sp.]